MLDGEVQGSSPGRMLNLEDLTYTEKFPPFLQALAFAHAPALCTEIASTAFFPFSSEPSTHRQSRPPQHSELQMMPRGGLTPQSLAPDGCIPKKNLQNEKNSVQGGSTAGAERPAVGNLGLGRAGRGKNRGDYLAEIAPACPRGSRFPAQPPAPLRLSEELALPTKSRGKKKMETFCN